MPPIKLTTRRELKVVDSWALVAWAHNEPDASAVELFFEAAEAGKIELLMSMLNVGETFYILAKRRNLQVAEGFLKRLPTLPISVIIPDEHGIMAAARVKAIHAVAYGDTFAIALAQSRGASVITGDPEIERSGLVQVDWVG